MRQLVESAQEEMQHSFSMLRNTATSVTSIARALNDTFPFVTIPHFRDASVEILDKGSIKMMGFAPVVASTEGTDEVMRWGEYSTKHQGWIEEYRSADGSRFPPPEPISETIIEGNVTVSTSEASFLVPLWQTVPVTSTTAGLVNTNLLTSTIEEVNRMLGKSVTNNVNVLTSINSIDLLFSNDYPRSSLIIAPVPNERTNGDNTSAVGGIVWALLSWDRLFSSKLPADAGRFLVEVRNNCDVELSYAVVDGDSGFIGEGLRHDPKFDDLAFRSYPFGADAEEFSECPFSVVAYPTITFKNGYVTDAPLVYMTGVLCVFFVSAVVFMLYDYNVQRKQAKLFHSAQKTSAIVAEIFPKNVQQRIIEEKQERERSYLNANRSNLAPKSELKQMMSKGDEKNGGVENYKGKPIADLFPETTIMVRTSVFLHARILSCHNVSINVHVHSSLPTLWVSQLGPVRGSRRPYLRC